MQEEVVPFEIVRMFLGEDPPLFYLEIIVRILIIYVYSLVLIRWVGGRGIAQMSTVEFLLVIALGSAVGDAMFYPEVPILHAMLVITGVVIVNKILDYLIFRFHSLERIIDGTAKEVVRDGVIRVSTLASQNIGRSEFFESVREAGFLNVGELRAAYLESSGRFSFVRAPVPIYGLPVDPPWTITAPLQFPPQKAIDKGERFACHRCGTLLREGAETTPEKCHFCSETAWVKAVLVSRANDP